MAQIDRFYIGQLESKGLITSLKPFAIPDDAFAQLVNAYVFRGRIRKRFGSRLMIASGTLAPQYTSRLKVLLGVSSGTSFMATIPAGAATTDPGQAFSVGDEFFTYNGTTTLLSIDSATGTYDGSTGILSLATLASASGTSVYWYPALPVMGLLTYIPLASSLGQGSNIEQVIAFDTKYYYVFGPDGWVCPLDGSSIQSPLWTGTNLNFFWGCNARGNIPATGAAIPQVLYVTNNKDSIYYLQNSGTALTWTPIVYQYGANSNQTINTARIIMFFKNRLIFMNITQNDTTSGTLVNTYVNRIRFSWDNDNLLDTANAFQTQVQGKGGLIDLPTSEPIVTAQFVKDRLIIFCEQSTWELVWTGNKAIPFDYQQINTELGAQSTFSEVPFDKVVLGVGNTGIHACNGANVTRIDEDIPQVVFDIQDDNNSPDRVAGIRDYYTEMVYWTIPTANRPSIFPYPNRVLTYNYKANTWGFNRDTITCWGYYQVQLTGTTPNQTWGSIEDTWEETGETWGTSIFQSKFKSAIAGNQEGFVFIVDPDTYSNADSLQITGLTITYAQPDPTQSQYIVTLNCTVIDHNLDENSYVRLANAWVTATMGGAPVLSNLNSVTFMVNFNAASSTTFTATSQLISILPNGTTYLGGGTFSLVTPVDILTKQYNFYATSARSVAVSQLDGLVDRTTGGEVSLDVMVSSNPNGMLQDSTVRETVQGTSVLSTTPYTLYPYEANQERLWHPVYVWGVGQYVQFRFYLTPLQTCTNTIADADFQLHAMMIYATSSGRLQ